MSHTSAKRKKINLNADVGESFGQYTIGNDVELIPLIESASIACGMHAGDPCTMAKTVGLALSYNKSIGAHPGFDDRWGFGRRQITMRPKDLELFVIYQIGALQAIADAQGGKVTHVKPHGALNNMAHDDIDYALAIARAIKAIDSNLVFVANVGSAMHKAGEKLGIPVARESYIDRMYDNDGKMLSRDQPNAMIRDPAKAVEHVLGIVMDGAITSVTGKKIPVSVDTFCVHGDELTAIDVTYAVRNALINADFEVVPIPQLDQ